MAAKTGTKAREKTITTGTSTSSKELGYFKSKGCLYHNPFGINNHNSKAKEGTSISTSQNGVNLQESSMVIVAVAGQVSSRQGGRLLCKYRPTTIDEASNAATNAKACNQGSNQEISKALHNPEVDTKASNIKGVSSSPTSFVNTVYSLLE